jgi:hypothetical protein
MEHQDAQALLELAAVEPAGFERLAAGDTGESAALASHLAGCPDCAAEFERLGRLSATLRTVIRELPPVDLRARTLTLVAETGRPRATGPAGEPMARDDEPAAAPSAMPAPVPIAAAGGRRQVRLWMLATAAAVLIAVAGFAGWRMAASDLAGQQAATATLTELTRAAIRVGSEPDAQRVSLTGTTAAADAAGQVVVSAGTAEIVMVAHGLPPAATGSEYGCWVEIDGVRQRIGRMEVSGDIASWAGWSEAVAGVGPGTRFGVSLVEIGSGAAGEPVLVGEL